MKMNKNKIHNQYRILYGDCQSGWKNGMLMVINTSIIKYSNMAETEPVQANCHMQAIRLKEPHFVLLKLKQNNVI